MRLTLMSLAMAATALFPAALPAADLDFQEMSASERAAFRNEVRNYLLENPEVIFEAIQILEQRRNMAAQNADRNLVAAHAEAIFEDGYSFVGGNPDGDITMVEFLDYRCGFCKRAHPEVQEVLDRDPNVRLIVKEFPILGPDSVAAGRMALAALDVDRSKYEDLSDALMSYNGNLTEQVAYKIASGVGYDIAELKARAGSSEIDARLQSNFALAQALNLQGTPAFIVGNEVIRGYLPVDELLGAIQDARAERS
ncbi:MAG: DsbA family protein [Pseudomonadota bacterium]